MELSNEILHQIFEFGADWESLKSFIFVSKQANSVLMSSTDIPRRAIEYEFDRDLSNIGKLDFDHLKTLSTLRQSFSSFIPTIDGNVFRGPESFCNFEVKSNTIIQMQLIPIIHEPSATFQSNSSALTPIRFLLITIDSARIFRVQPIVRDPEHQSGFFVYPAYPENDAPHLPLFKNEVDINNFSSDHNNDVPFFQDSHGIQLPITNSTLLSSLSVFDSSGVITSLIDGQSDLKVAIGGSAPSIIFIIRMHVEYLSSGDVKVTLASPMQSVPQIRSIRDLMSPIHIDVLGIGDNKLVISRPGLSMVLDCQRNEQICVLEEPETDEDQEEYSSQRSRWGHILQNLIPQSSSRYPTLLNAFIGQTVEYREDSEDDSQNSRSSPTTVKKQNPNSMYCNLKNSVYNTCQNILSTHTNLIRLFDLRMTGLPNNHSEQSQDRQRVIRPVMQARISTVAASCVDAKENKVAVGCGVSGVVSVSDLRKYSDAELKNLQLRKSYDLLDSSHPYYNYFDDLKECEQDNNCPKSLFKADVGSEIMILQAFPGSPINSDAGNGVRAIKMDIGLDRIFVGGDSNRISLFRLKDGSRLYQGIHSSIIESYTHINKEIKKAAADLFKINPKLKIGNHCIPRPPKYSYRSFLTALQQYYVENERKYCDQNEKRICSAGNFCSDCRVHNCFKCSSSNRSQVGNIAFSSINSVSKTFSFLSNRKSKQIHFVASQTGKIFHNFAPVPRKSEDFLFLNNDFPLIDDDEHLIRNEDTSGHSLLDEVHDDSVYDAVGSKNTKETPTPRVTTSTAVPMDLASDEDEDDSYSDNDDSMHSEEHAPQAQLVPYNNQVAIRNNNNQFGHRLMSRFHQLVFSSATASSILGNADSAYYEEISSIQTAFGVCAIVTSKGEMALFDFYPSIISGQENTENIFHSNSQQCDEEKQKVDNSLM